MSIALYLYIFFLLPSCTKSSLHGADSVFAIKNSNISIIDDSGGRVVLENSMVVKTVAFQADALFNGGYAYSSVIKFPDGTYYIVAAGHPLVWGDFNPAALSSKISKDSGRTWTDGKTMQENIGKLNTSDPCLLNLSGNGMLSLFLVKNSYTDIQIVCKESDDYGATWSAPVTVSDSIKGYNITMNGRLCKTKAGRLVLPVAFMHDVLHGNENQQLIYCYVSDDNGKTWRKTKSYGCYTALTEPGITELEDGSLLMCLRNNTGHVLFTTSKDGGETWGDIQKSKITTPQSPQAIVYSHKHHALFMVWNDSAVDPSNYLNRHILSLAVSYDGGINWLKKGDLENSEDYSFYPSLITEGDDLVISYSKYLKTFSKPFIVFTRFDIPKLIY